MPAKAPRKTERIVLVMCGTFFYYQDSSYVGLEFNICVLKERSNKYASHKGFTQPEKTERLSS